jgi:hypothetical protein
MFSPHQLWGNIGKITDTNFELAAAIINTPIGLYLVLSRKQLWFIISKMQSTFHNYINNPHFGRKHRLILREASSRNAIFSWIVIATNFKAILMWVICPFVLGSTEMKQENTESTNSIYNQEINWKYLFQNVATTQRHTHNPVYHNLWVYQTFKIYILVRIFT